MARITMRNSQKATFAEVFEIYISAVTARGVKDKTIATYKQHFHAISKRLDVSLPINRLNSTALDNMILQMRKEGLSDSSINSYTRTLKCFLSWCNEEGYTKAKYSFDDLPESAGSQENLLQAFHFPDEAIQKNLLWVTHRPPYSFYSLWHSSGKQSNDSENRLPL